jgi:hypothetical protein
MSISRPDKGPEIDFMLLLLRASATKGFRTASMVLDLEATPRAMITSVMSS